MDNLRVQYTPRLMKNKNKILITTFINRLSNNFLIIMFLLVAFDLNTCNNNFHIVLIISLLSSIFFVQKSYKKFVADIMYMAEEEKEIKITEKISLWTREFFIQFVSSLLMLWWVDNVHECFLFYMTKINQGYTWIVIFVLNFILHVSNAKMNLNQSEKIIKTVYQHVETTGEV